MKEPKRFEGDYVRGGPGTLFLTRADLVEALAMVRDRYPGQLRGIMMESAHALAVTRTERRAERERELSGRCRCRFVRTGARLDRSACRIHEVAYGCDSCGCDEYRPTERKRSHDHWPLCSCGHIAQAHNRRPDRDWGDDPTGRRHGRDE